MFIVGIIFLITFIPTFTLLAGITIELAATLLSAIVGVVVLIIQIPLCIGAIFFKKKFPKWHEQAGFKPSKVMIVIYGILGAVFSALFLLLLFLDPDAGLIISLIVFPFMGIGIILYVIKNAKLKREGVDIKGKMKNLPESVLIDE